MRKTVLVVPDWLSASDGDSALRSNTPSLQRLAEIGSVERISKIPETGAVEASYLGLNPRQAQIEQGPLIVAAFGADPPARSIHYQLTMMSFDGTLIQSLDSTSKEELAALWTETARLNSRLLTILPGNGAEGGMVIEDGSPEMRIDPPYAISGQPLDSHWPQAEDERMLRQLIDDSVNLLSEHEINLRRIDEGKPPINLLWPWGGGLRPRMPNLALDFGFTAKIVSASLRVEGLTRLVGWKHAERSAFGRGTNTKLEWLLGQIRAHGISIVVLEALSEFRKDDKIEEVHWLTNEIDRRLIELLLSDVIDKQTSLMIVAPSVAVPGIGLSLVVSSGLQTERPAPFDERALDDQSLKISDVWERITTYLRWNSNS